MGSGTSSRNFEVQGLKCDVLETIHKGRYSTCFKVEDSRTKATYCLKRVFLPSQHIEKCAAMIQEIRLLNKISRNKYIIKNIAHHRERTKKAIECALLLEYVEGGSVRSLLNSNSMNIKQKVLCIHQVAKGLKHLHSNMILHLNIRPSSILAKENHFILTDLGSAIEIGTEDLEGGAYKRVKEFDSPYRAPEVFLRQPCLTPSSDVFSLGVLLYEFLFLTLPFSEVDLRTPEKYQKSKLIFTGQCPADVWNILQEMLEFTPKARYSLVNVLDSMQTLYEQLTTHNRTRSAEPEWLQKFEKDDRKTLIEATSEDIHKYGRVTDDLRGQIHRHFGLDRHKIKELEVYILNLRREQGVTRKGGEFREEKKRIDALVLKAVRGDSPPKFKYLQNLLITLWEFQKIEFASKKKMAIISHRIYHVLKKYISHPVNVFKSLHILHFLLFNGTPEFLTYSIEQTTNSAYYSKIEELYLEEANEQLSNGQVVVAPGTPKNSIFGSLIIEHCRCLVDKITLHQTNPILEGNFSMGMYCKQALEYDEINTENLGADLISMLTDMMELAESFIAYGENIQRDVIGRYMEGIEQNDKALKENDLSFIQEELSSMYKTLCYCMGLLNITNEEEVLRLSDEFISVMQHILNFVQGLNSSSLPLKNCSLDPVPQNMTDLIRFADCQIYPPQSLSPNLSMDNAELMINFRNRLKTQRYGWSKGVLAEITAARLRIASTESEFEKSTSTPTMTNITTQINFNDNNDNNFQNSPLHPHKHISHPHNHNTITTSKNTTTHQNIQHHMKETRKKTATTLKPNKIKTMKPLKINPNAPLARKPRLRVSEPVNIYQTTQRTRTPLRQSTPPPQPHRGVPKINPNVLGSAQERFDQGSSHDGKPAMNLIDDPFALLDLLHQPYDNQSAKDGTSTCTPSDSYMSGLDGYFGDGYYIEDFGTANLQSTNPFEVPEDENGNSSPSFSVSMGPPDTNRIWADFEEAMNERKMSSILEMDENHKELEPLDELEWDDLEIRDRIGIGGFAEVFKALYGEEMVAAKRIILQRVNEDMVDEFKKEVALMRILNHKNIVKFKGACTVPPNLCVVTELLEMSLFDLLHNTTIRINWKIRHRIALGTTVGLDYLHKNDPPIIHRDLKSANILLDKRFHPRITDFGLSRIKDNQDTMTAQTGTFQWMAPEVIGGRFYDEQADIYSLAVILWELCTSKIPFDGMNGVQVSVAVMTKRQRPTMDNDIRTFPSAWRHMIVKAWEHEPQHRPSTNEIMDWLRRISSRPEQ